LDKQSKERRREERESEVQIERVVPRGERGREGEREREISAKCDEGCESG
jgi:hypothetical protein